MLNIYKPQPRPREQLFPLNSQETSESTLKRPSHRTMFSSPWNLIGGIIFSAFCQPLSFCLQDRLHNLWDPLQKEHVGPPVTENCKMGPAEC